VALGLSTSPEAAERRLFEIPGSEVIPIRDSGSGREYELYIKLPPNYSKDKKYPAVYIMDAKENFQIVSGAMSYPTNFGYIDGLILVGISWEKDFRPDLSRQRDYTPTVAKGFKDPTGQADKHLAFIRNDVIKYVEQNYSADPGRRAYVGHSFGGLFGGYILLTQPDTFQNYILGSPSFWYDNEVIMTIESENAKKHADIDARVYISVGQLEGPPYTKERHQMPKLAEAFYSRLKSRNYKNLSIKFETIASANHATAFPTTATQGLWWLFKTEYGKGIFENTLN
jgi:predicted alpha/beta superfamily hydrolase